jgi:DNA-binding transcriptional regulator GbsR (MarR family)
VTIQTDEFARLAGELAESFSFNRSLGQIYGLLYMSSVPLALGEIARQLGMSKGNASINLRVLESWGAVRPVWMKGSRQDHYEANRDIKTLALRRLEEGMTKRLDLAEDRLRKLIQMRRSGGGPVLNHTAVDRLEELYALVGRARKSLQMVRKLGRLL